MPSRHLACTHLSDDMPSRRLGYHAIMPSRHLGCISMPSRHMVGTIEC